VRAFDQAAPAAAAAPSPEALDKLLAPVALYPDQLLAQMLLCAQTAPKVQELSGWLIRNPELKGTALQDAVQKAGSLDLGGFKLSYSPTSNRGSDQVFLTVIQPDGSFKAVDRLEKSGS
jgi:hypothetical protein